MRINVKKPHSDENLVLDATPAENDKEPGWSVILPAGNSIFITLVEGEWKVRHNKMIDPDFVKAIGEAINPFSGKQEKTWEIPKDPEKATDERNGEQLFRQRKQAEFRNNDLTGNCET